MWIASLDGDDRIEGSPTFADGIVYVGGNKLYAFNAQTGHRVWTALVGTQSVGNPGPFITYGAPTIVNGVVYIGSTDTLIKMYAFDAKTGKPLWAIHTNGIIVSVPTVVDNIVYIGTYNGIFYALDAKTGATIWTASIKSPIYSSPTVVNNTVYVGNSVGTVYAFDAKAGGTLWSTNVGGFLGSTAFADGDLYIASQDNGLFKLNASTGQLLWNAKSAGGRITASPALANGVVYIGSSEDHKMYAFDAQTGARLWSAPWTDGTGQDNISFNCTPVVVNGVIYVGSGDGKLYTYYLPT
ncbi:MAG: PQQ-binding-like beta-propeller repeat protein [Ktedonobacteraceae bacterium]|nr:PQQ-binding-like beta-propeller repeat protein [Ktedonobacteraceae bacterium]